MEHISTLNAGVFTSMAKRLNLNVGANNSAHGFIGDICENGFAIHLHNCTDIRSFSSVTINRIPSLQLVVKRFVDGEVADKLSIDVWEYSDISKAIDAVKNFIG